MIGDSALQSIGYGPESPARNVDSGPSSDLLNKNLHFTKIPRQFICILRFVKHSCIKHHFFPSPPSLVLAACLT